MREVRLGDVIDDYCVKCKRIMNHSVVSILNEEPAKVRCRTCHSDHDYRHEQAPPPKVDLRKQALFSEVLEKVDPGAAVEDEDELDEAAEEAPAAEPPKPAPAKVAPAPKAKKKVKGK
jgi:hypothetical protein